MTTGTFMEKLKELRSRTGIGIAKCKEALQEAGGNIDEAIKHLRKKGLASAVKKAGRETKEGMVAIGESDGMVALVEINAETDFVVKNQIFQDFAAEVAKIAATSGVKTTEKLGSQPWSSDPSHTVEEQRTTVVQTLGENIQIKRMALLVKQADNSIGTYSHMGGQIAVAVEIKGSNDCQDLSRDLAMHIAAEAPEYVDSSQVPESILEHEREIAREQVKNKPPQIIDKIVEGKVRAYLDGVCLVAQKFVKDPSKTVGELIEARGKQLSVKQFLRWSVGG